MKLTARNIGVMTAACAAALGSSPAIAQTGAPQAGTMTLSVAPDEVSAVYASYRPQPIWTRAGINEAAVAQLTSILQRAAFDRFAEGPQLAAQVQAAAAQARSGDPAAMTAAEHTLSSAWVRSVPAVRRPTAGMIYAYPVLKPHGTRIAEILLTASAAPSLEQYLHDASNPNPIYVQLRDTAIAEAQASGNMTPDPRLLANLDRVRSIPATGRFLVVDAGSSMLTLYENGQPLNSMKIITGTKELPTPMIASMMFYITYNPYWHAPDHLVRKTIAPNVIHLGLGYFKSHKYDVIDEWSENPTIIDPTTIDWKAAASGTLHLKIRQGPGPLNSMGILKFPFANSEDIYLHDTPDHAKFGLTNRNLSNGCVRVEDAKRLGRWLIGSDPVAPGTDPETRVRLPMGTPIYLTYITAQVKDGKIIYLTDLYGWDAPGAQFGYSTAAASE